MTLWQKNLIQFDLSLKNMIQFKFGPESSLLSVIEHCSTFRTPSSHSPACMWIAPTFLLNVPPHCQETFSLLRTQTGSLWWMSCKSSQSRQYASVLHAAGWFQVFLSWLAWRMFCGCFRACFQKKKERKKGWKVFCFIDPSCADYQHADSLLYRFLSFFFLLFFPHTNSHFLSLFVSLFVCISLLNCRFLKVWGWLRNGRASSLVEATLWKRDRSPESKTTADKSTERLEKEKK